MDAPADRSIADVLGDIVNNLQGIIRSEVRLAKAELRDDAARAKRGLVLLAAAALIGVLALAFFMLAAVYGLTTVMAPWAAALIVAAGSAAVAGIVVAAGLKSFQDLGLPKTAATIQENVQWAKTRVK